ncbi:MAG: ribosomal RNA small subunit methyltransferase A [Sulfobacillus benefaciens]|uniref:Ribosomal RNA small subunit methyltransferase A n=1 Tax=Sulfobacillus benefaciens TaxID=453960 RepID=A0A2T2XGG1_9FIRM|nr:MAG: ribosomal RNA small subunit methyltransferase A [Sulfobacillus benefaciens]
MIDPRTRSGILDLVQNRGLGPYKPLGQHFLVNLAMIQRIVDLLPQGSRQAVEIGPGPGGLTLTLLEQDWRVVAIELDHRWVRFLSETWGKQFYGRLSVVEADALALNWAALPQQFGLAAPLTFIGNLPYYITGPLLAKFAGESVPWHTAVVMVQKEVADRLTTPPGSRQSNALGVILRYNATIEREFTIAPSHFYPVPEVDSAVIKLTHGTQLPVGFPEFHWVVHSGFTHRRKMLRQALAIGENSPYPAEQWESLMRGVGLNPTARAENLTIEEWVVLARLLPSQTR